MHTRWMASVSSHEGGLLLDPYWIQCKLYDIYQKQCILYLPDAMKSVSSRFDTNCVYPCGYVAGRLESSNNTEGSG